MGIERQAAKYMADVAEAIVSVKSGETSFGTFHVNYVGIGFDGDSTDYVIVPNEHGDYDIEENTP